MKRSLSDLLPDVETREFKVENIDLALIKESTSQARKKFDNTKIQELKNSIMKNGEGCSLGHLPRIVKVRAMKNNVIALPFSRLTAGIYQRF